MTQLARILSGAGLTALLSVFLAIPVVAAPPTFQTTAKQAILLDFDTGAVLFAKNAGTPMFPASMT